MSNAIWQIEADSAKLQTASLAATLDLLRPALGLHNIAINDRTLESTKIFQLGQPQATIREIEDCYCRGHDLIVTYAQSKEHPLRTQLIWRYHDFSKPSGKPSGTSGVELIVSVETDSLGTDPQLCVESTIAAQQTLRLDESGSTFALIDDAAEISNGYLFRLSDAPDSIAHFVHPDDFCTGSLSSQSLSSQKTPQAASRRIAHPLFSGDLAGDLAGNLEKGVILRARLGAFFFTGNIGNTGEETENAIAAYRQFIAQPLPLAT